MRGPIAANRHGFACGPRAAGTAGCAPPSGRRRQPAFGRFGQGPGAVWPVPMTMQTFAVLIIGMTYGPRLGWRRWRSIWPRCDGLRCSPARGRARL